MVNYNVCTATKEKLGVTTSIFSNLAKVATEQKMVSAESKKSRRLAGKIGR